MRKNLLLATTAVVIVGVAAATILIYSTSDEVVRAMAVSGQVALVPIRISGTEMEEVEDVVRSCGCMQLLDNQKEELKLPRILASDELFSGFVEIATRGRLGLTHYDIIARGSAMELRSKREFALDWTSYLVLQAPLK